MKSAVVQFSGGLDSTFCLLWAKKQGYDVHGLMFEYGQNNYVELNYAEEIARLLEVPVELLNLTELFERVSCSAMIGNKDDIGQYRDDGKPKTFVEGRNLIFYAIAVAYAKKIGAEVIISGNQQLGQDFYPDNRDVFIKAMNVASSLATDSDLEFVSPIVKMPKTEIITNYTNGTYIEPGMGYKLLGLTYTCYTGSEPSCGTCPSCKRRKQAFSDLGIDDLIPYAI